MTVDCPPSNIKLSFGNTTSVMASHPVCHFTAGNHAVSLALSGPQSQPLKDIHRHRGLTKVGDFEVGADVVCVLTA